MASSYAVNLNDGLVPIEDFIQAGLQRQLANLFSCTVSWVQSTDKKRVVQSQSSEGKLAYPFLVLTMTDINDSDSSFNAKYMALNGFPVALSREGNTYSRVSFLPVQCNVAVEYYTNSAPELMRFVNKWKFAGKRGQLHFNVKYGRTTFAIRVIGSPSLSLPVREANPSETQEYLVTTQITMDSYLSSDMVTSDLATEINATAHVAADGVTAEEAVANASTQFWEFSSKETTP